MSEEKHAAEGAADAPAKSGKLKLIIIAVVGIVLGLGIAAGAFFALGEHPPAPEPADEADAGDHGDGEGDGEKKKKKKKKKKHDGPELPPVYMKLDNLTVNLAGKDHFLACSLELKIAEPEAQAALSARLPEVKNLVLITLSAQTPDSLTTVEGKTGLAQKLRDDLNALIDQDEDTGIADVFFTQFIIQ